MENEYEKAYKELGKEYFSMLLEFSEKLKKHFGVDSLKEVIDIVEKNM
jgi:hypothetical protein